MAGPTVKKMSGGAFLGRSQPEGGQFRPPFKKEDVNLAKSSNKV